MTVFRENILASAIARDKFLNGVVALDQTDSGITAQDVFNFIQANQATFPGVSMFGRQQTLSWYDLFVLWHFLAMNIPLPVGNAAHSGPIFLPWHRLYLIRLEEVIQQVTNDDEFALPYWDWAQDGELPRSQQWQTVLWTDTYIGEPRNRVLSGPLSDMRVRLVEVQRRVLQSTDPRPIEREAGLSFNFPELPSQDNVFDAMQDPVYDAFPWNANAATFRNKLEGFFENQNHNLVHIWIGGDMGPGTSPNDPAFFLNHCNVDRIWEAWMANNGRTYTPGANAGPAGHRINNQMYSLLGQALTPNDVLDPMQWYEYDTLSVF